MLNIKRYQVSAADLANITKDGTESELHPLLQRIYVARGVNSTQYLDYSLAKLLPYQTLSGIDAAISCLYQALLNQQRVLIVGDFDVDGATSTTLAILALHAFGLQNIAYLIPNRFEFGYGLTPEIVAVTKQQPTPPDIIITVDNGIASHEGVLVAKEHGIKIIITDHHLPNTSVELPVADAIVNPNKIGDAFTSKNLAGVGVIFYLMLALRGFLRTENWFTKNNIPEPNMAQFLDLVALGTAADLVHLDYNNRILVNHGLERIRAGKCRLGLKILLRLANRDYEKIKVDDLVYIVAPRLNAAGRLDDMSVGVACLLSDNLQHVRLLARELDNLNKERRVIEQGMQQQALQELAKLQFIQPELPPALCIFKETWHQGVIGILASKLKERFHRPTIVFAAINDEELKGSARSVPSLHLRDILDEIAVQHPGLMVKFGGHAMAAGVTLRRADYPKFQTTFIDVIQQKMQQGTIEDFLYTDGELPNHYFSLEIAELLRQSGPWGHGFPEPLFDGIFDLTAQRIIGEKHLKVTLRNPETLQELDGIHFNIDIKTWPNYRITKVHAVYRLDVNEYNGRRNLQLLLERLKPLEPLEVT